MDDATTSQSRTRLSQHDKNVRSREYGKGFNQQRKIRLPLSAWRRLDDIAARSGISLPGLLLALTNADRATLDQLQDWAAQAAQSHGHFLSIEKQDGTRTRISAGHYRRGTGS